MSNILFCPDCGNKIQPHSSFCSGCGRRIESEQLDKSKNKMNYAASNNNIKRNRILNSGHTAKRKTHNGLYASVITIIIVGVIWYFAAQPSKEEKIIDKQPKVTGNVTYPSSRYDLTYTLAFAKGNKIILPLDLVKEKKLVKFDFLSKGEKIPLLAYLTEDGKVVTAISMCEPCNSTSFHIIGDNIICNSCGTTWNLNTLNAVRGSCSKYPPDPLPSTVVGNEIQIEKSLVDNWTRRI